MPLSRISQQFYAGEVFLEASHGFLARPAGQFTDNLEIDRCEAENCLKREAYPCSSCPGFGHTTVLYTAEVEKNIALSRKLEAHASFTFLFLCSALFIRVQPVIL
jgi:hypothetical protein